VIETGYIGKHWWGLPLLDVGWPGEGVVLAWGWVANLLPYGPDVELYILIVHLGIGCAISLFKSGKPLVLLRPQYF